MTPNQFKNVLAFCSLMSGESPEVLHQSPEYIIEKYCRYINAEPFDDDRWAAGHHVTLRPFIDAYHRRWRLDEPGMMELLCRQPLSY